MYKIRTRARTYSPGIQDSNNNTFQMIVMSNGTQRNPIAASFLGPSKIGIDFNWADVPPANRLSLRLTENFATDDVYRAAMPVRHYNNLGKGEAADFWSSLSKEQVHQLFSNPRCSLASH
jgi:hypothetical protein